MLCFYQFNRKLNINLFKYEIVGLSERRFYSVLNFLKPVQTEFFIYSRSKAFDLAGGAGERCDSQKPNLSKISTSIGETTVQSNLITVCACLTSSAIIRFHQISAPGSFTALRELKLPCCFWRFGARCCRWRSSGYRWNCTSKVQARRHLGKIRRMLHFSNAVHFLCGSLVNPDFLFKALYYTHVCGL